MLLLSLTVGLWPVQLAKRYVNAHALVDLCLSAVFDPTLGSSKSASTKKVQEACIVISTPTVIEKGALSPLERIAGVARLRCHHVENNSAAPQALRSITKQNIILRELWDIQEVPCQLQKGRTKRGVSSA